MHLVLCSEIPIVQKIRVFDNALYDLKVMSVKIILNSII